MLTKDEVLSLYLDLAPYGGNIEGVRAASLAYFGKEPRRLSLGEAALLVALPQSPESRRPDRWAEAARSARNRVLDRFAALGTVPADEIALAKAEPVPAGRHADAHAGAACGRSRGRAKLRARKRNPAHHRRRLAEKPGGAGARAQPDAGCRRSAPTSRSRSWSSTMRPARCAAHVGSPDYFDAAPRRRGRYDAGAALARLDAQAVHLRPRLRGRLHPPRDADRRPAGALRRLCAAEFRFHLPGHGDGAAGRCRLSLNVPALAVLDQVGASRLDRAAHASRRARSCCRKARRRVSPSASAASASSSPIW